MPGSYEALKKFLQHMQAGPLSTESCKQLEVLLTAAWEEFDGHELGGMFSWKLADRLEDASWHPPHLSFTIERHGGSALGSTRAELQDWILDIDKKQAEVSQGRFRQIRKAAARLDVEAIADEIADLILEHRSDPNVKWMKNGSVRVSSGELLGGNAVPKRTMEGRRRKFRARLEVRLGAAGWRSGGYGIYRPPEAT